MAGHWDTSRAKSLVSHKIQIARSGEFDKDIVVDLKTTEHQLLQVWSEIADFYYQFIADPGVVVQIQKQKSSV